MATATVTTKGQITIPRAVRTELDISAGDRVEFVAVGPGRFEVVAATRSVRELKGMFGPARRVVSIEEMNEAVTQSAVASAALSRRR
jgi:AbrB family looped-hinge helix DNA binding protein